MKSYENILIHVMKYRLTTWGAGTWEGGGDLTLAYSYTTSLFSQPIESYETDWQLTSPV